MNMKLLLVFILSITLYYGNCHNEFTPDACLQAHNELRKLHVDTKDLTYSKELEQKASVFIEQLMNSDTTRDIRPTRVLPKRRKRHLNQDIDPNKHIESWDGEIFYPSGSRLPNNYYTLRHWWCPTFFPEVYTTILKLGYNVEI